VWAAVGDTGNEILAIVLPLLLAALTLAFFAFAAYRKERRRPVEEPPVAPRKTGSPARPSAAPAGSVSQRGTVVAAMVAVDPATDVQKQAFHMLPAVEVKVCRKCDREFRTALSHCPFDQSRLVPKSQHQGGQATTREDYLDTRRALMRCGNCEREFDLGARFCPYDGESLAPYDEEDDGIFAEGEMMCPECSEVYDEDAVFCPDDGSRLVPQAANRTHAGAVPILICPACMSEFPPSATRCPKDGHELLPLAGRKTGGSPIQGVGPRDRICPKCGGKYASDAMYCASDGSELLSMN
jgi:DNA-directed RNA polymerase subunit M/transcription elongation factor TFIIS